MNLRQHWSELYAGRLEWAETEYLNFVEGLDVAINAYMVKHKKEVTVVLYGVTQVGKTTLLLKLLGISDDSMPEVSKILRGKQTEGRSSTSMPSRYRISDDGNWWKNRVKLDAAGLEDDLYQLRNAVVTGEASSQLKYAPPIEIAIPRQYFEESSLHGTQINIIDLPGLNSDNDHEKEHVKYIAKKYVPTADLILMVGCADSLSFFRPGELPIPELDDWSITPHRFRFITTYSISRAGETRKSWLKSGINPSKNVLRKMTLEEIKKFEFEINDQFGELIYPLEYGLSWDQLKEHDTALFNKAKPIINELFDDLCEDIKKSATDHNRIMQAAKLHVGIEKMMMQEINKRDGSIESLRKAIEKLVIDAENFDKAANSEQSRVAALRGKIFNEKQSENEIKNLIICAILAQPIPNFIGTHSKYFLGYLTRQQEQILNGALSLMSYEKWEDIFYSCTNVTEVNKIINESLGNIRAKLNKDNSEYYPSLPWSDFEQDMNCATQSVNEAAYNVKNHIIKSSMNEVRASNSKKIKLIAKHTNQAESYLEGAKKLRAQIEERQEEIDKHICEKEALKKQYTPRIKQSKNFRNAIENGAKNEIARRKLEFVQLKNSVDKFLNLCAAVQVGREYKKLMSIE